jgi:hypothetical protein
MKEIIITIDSERVRNIATSALKRDGKSQAGAFGTDMAQAFLTVHGEALAAAVEQTIVKFIAQKVGAGEGR